MTFLYHEQTSCWFTCDMSLHKSPLPPLSIWTVHVKVNLSFERTDKTITFYNILICPPNWTYILDLDTALLWSFLYLHHISLGKYLYFLFFCLRHSRDTLDFQVSHPSHVSGSGGCGNVCVAADPRVSASSGIKYPRWPLTAAVHGTQILRRELYIWRGNRFFFLNA